VNWTGETCEHGGYCCNPEECEAVARGKTLLEVFGEEERKKRRRVESLVDAARAVSEEACILNDNEQSVETKLLEAMDAALEEIEKGGL